MEEIEIVLTPEQEQKMIDRWNQTPSSPPNFSELTLAVFGEEHDGRDKYGKAIKTALSKRNLKAKSTIYENKTAKISLTDSDKLFIQNNRDTMSSIELAKIIFKKNHLTGLNAETKIVIAYIQTIKEKNETVDEGMITESYRPPSTLEGALRRINEYTNNSLDKEKLSSKQKKDIHILIDYLHNNRLIKQLNNYEREDDRKTFEDAFIRYTYNKPDLTQEEVDQYIILCHEVVSSFKIQRRIERLQTMMENVADNADQDNVKLSMSLVEAINSAQGEYSDCVKRQDNLTNALTGKRSARLTKNINDNGSVLNFFNAWKEEETRQDFLKMAALEQSNIKDEFQRINDMDDIRARILGVTSQEILDG